MANKTHVSRPLNDGRLFGSQVDIIVPFHGQYEMVTALLDSIFRLTRSNYFNVCVVDDNSPNEDYIKILQKNSNKIAEKRKVKNNLSSIRLDCQHGYGEACYAGFKATESPYVCFIHSDCLIEDLGWLRSLGECLLSLKEQGVRMVSPMTNNPVVGDPAQKGEKHVRSDEPVVLASDSFLSLYCFLCHRQLFQKIGGFIKGYPFCGYEDEELAHRMRYHGYKQAVCRSSWVHHEGEATMREIMRRDPNGAGNISEANRLRCIEDMRKFLP